MKRSSFLNLYTTISFIENTPIYTTIQIISYVLNTPSSHSTSSLDAIYPLVKTLSNTPRPLCIPNHSDLCLVEGTDIVFQDSSPPIQSDPSHPSIGREYFPLFRVIIRNIDEYIEIVCGNSTYYLYVNFYILRIYV